MNKSPLSYTEEGIPALASTMLELRDPPVELSMLKSIVALAEERLRLVLDAASPSPALALFNYYLILRDQVDVMEKNGGLCDAMNSEMIAETVFDVAVVMCSPQMVVGGI